MIKIKITWYRRKFRVQKKFTICKTNALWQGGGLQVRKDFTSIYDILLYKYVIQPFGRCSGPLFNPGRQTINLSSIQGCIKFLFQGSWIQVKWVRFERGKQRCRDPTFSFPSSKFKFFWLLGRNQLKFSIWGKKKVYYRRRKVLQPSVKGFGLFTGTLQGI